MYKFVVSKGSCGSPYDVSKSEKDANAMAQEGYELVQVYQSTTPGCGGGQSVLVMVFKRREA